jgi:hypothetical protein
MNNFIVRGQAFKGKDFGRGWGRCVAGCLFECCRDGVCMLYLYCMYALPEQYGLYKVSMRMGKEEEL